MNCLDDDKKHVTEMIDGKIQIKARLGARGFEDSSRDELGKDSPTCGGENLKLMFALASSCNWKIDTMDIKSTFYTECQ